MEIILPINPLPKWKFSKPYEHTVWTVCSYGLNRMFIRFELYVHTVWTVCSYGLNRMKSKIKLLDVGFEPVIMRFSNTWYTTAPHVHMCWKISFKVFRHIETNFMRTLKLNYRKNHLLINHQRTTPSPKSRS